MIAYLIPLAIALAGCGGQDFGASHGPAPIEADAGGDSLGLETGSEPEVDSGLDLGQKAEAHADALEQPDALQGETGEAEPPEGGQGDGGPGDAQRADAACSSPSDCPSPDNVCLARVCVSGACGTSFTQAGTALHDQTAGDCTTVVCDGSGATTTRSDPADLPPSRQNVCETPSCDGGAPHYEPVAAGTSCDSGNVCDGKGACCTPTTSCGGVVCGVIDDGCGGTITCGPAYHPNATYDYPYVNSDGHCTQEKPHHWSCGGAIGLPGNPPYTDCQVWGAPNSAWCCPESS